MQSVTDATSVSVVMPSYNERENIGDALRRISAALGPRLAEIIVVDDDSPDRTWEVVDQYGDPRFRAIRRTEERGLASALADGTLAAKSDIVVWMDCDLGIPPEEIPRLLAKLDGAEAVIGSRYTPGGKDDRPWTRTIYSVVLNRFCQALLGSGIKDYTSGFAAVRREALAQVPLSRTGFGDYFIDWAFRFLKAGFRITEVGYVYGLRQSGVSKTDGDWRRFFSLGFSYAWRVVKIRLGKY